MKAVAYFVFLSAFLAPGLLAQTQANPAPTQPVHKIRLSAGVAEKLLLHKVTPVLTPSEAEARGTTVVVVEIGTNGDVLSAKAISGPAVLEKPVLDAVRKYKYKPFLLNGEAIEVETTVSVTISSY